MAYSKIMYRDEDDYIYDNLEDLLDTTSGDSGEIAVYELKYTGTLKRAFVPTVKKARKTKAGSNV